ncbi:putative 1-phosphatidylinositol-3-phosphate 5-kinase FAB1D [Asparagus officinalis]|uniref:putative 1-phosphatidylinositol-3-phosphate 5-kinase FAB1D n=1 Tax=Asparagus officinalis TaxID=4686 RepID=UPI00098E7040|nr:putative 1-phosphatidylinositol-3-phosphate 5-kinase FAB1D [Asparagus officinalis]
MCCVCISQQENSVRGCCCKPGCPSFCLEIERENLTSSDMHSNSRENENAALHTSQEQTKHSILHSEELESKDSLGNTDKNRLDVMLERSGDSTDDKFGLHHSRTLEDVRSIIDGDESDGSESAIDSSNPSFLSTTETDPAIWELPEPADINMDSVANNDDDDEYSDGTKWGQSSCLSGFDVENGSNIKEERQKAMMEAMNGQFKILVSRFLASEDISFSEGGNGDKWLDIVASLSWEAALLIKPEASKGKAMDPGSYVKVKCVATGARTQSEVIRGLAFKKNTAHKHMPTKCKNPRLLLLKGVLGHREVGLSSFESMSEEKDGYLKSIHELITKCNPNVVLVERSVSRDMQEFLLEKGMTLVFDMKLTRLNRIARCIGSPIISCTDILTCSKVKQCDMFRIEKFIEEHNCSSEGGKRSSKTLMFLEGFPKPLGCTILLKGAPIVELKKIKRVLQYTVFAAYHLILETSFFADQRALFSDMYAEGNGYLNEKTLPTNFCADGDRAGIIESYALDAPSSNGSLENSIRVFVMSAAARVPHLLLLSDAIPVLDMLRHLTLPWHILEHIHTLISGLSSKCGHSLHRDCLRFFGLGSKVAMFRYSSVEIYAACKPPPVMLFNNLNGQEWIKREAKSVLQKGDLLFSEVANFLQKLKHGDFGVFHKQSKNSSAAVKDLRKVEEMLNQEKSEFEESLLKAINFSGQMGMGVNEILSLSWLNQELLFELYIWDLRLQSLLQCTKDNTTSADEIQEKNSGNCDMDNNGNHQVADLHSSVENGHSVPVTANASFVQDQEECLSSSEDSCNSKTNDPNEWIWTNAVELLRDYRIDLHGGSLQKFDYVHSYTPKYLTPIKLVAQDKESLHFPLGADGGVISLFEDDISSIVSCALALYEHQYGQTENTDEKDLLEGKVEPNVAIENSVSQPSDSTIASSFWSSNGSLESEGIHPSRSISSISSDESATSCSESSFPVDRLIDSECLHPEIPVGYGKQAARSKYSVVLVHAKEFYALRKMCCSSELAYISSLSRSKKWDAQGGKSKAFFAKTLDDRFIIKQVKKTEIDSFLKFAPDYFKHISFSIKTGSQTCLAKILGIYQVRQNRGGKEVKTDLMVMENLLFGRNFTRTYDLKGAIFSRYVSDPNDPEKKVLLDQNFMEDMRISPMYIAGRNKHLFQRAIWNDTSFLTSINVMDYSLLVGVDKQRHELVFGIIDYLRQYTWDKHLESWVKSSLVLPKNSLPTVISPKDYKNRFRKFMSKYFLTIPDAMESSTMLNGTKTSSIENLQSSQVAEVS